MPALWEGLTGGAMIGASAATLLLFNGDILGASGIVRSLLLTPIQVIKDESQHWKLTLLSSFFLTNYLMYTTSKSDSFTSPPSQTLSKTAYILAGLFVGWGTTMGNGCTSGHGICGLARLSRRSFAAVGTFMATAITSTVLAYHTRSLERYTRFLQNEPVVNETWTQAGLGLTLALVATAVATPLLYSKSRSSQAKLAPAAVAGSLFAAGLQRSQMMFQDRVFGFLNVAALKNGTWDPTLCMVMVGGVLVSFASYQWVPSHRVLTVCRPLPHPVACNSKFSVPCNTVIDSALIKGAAAFGVGWGLAGLCPGPAMIQAGLGNAVVSQYWWPAFIFGSYVARQMKA
jgi:uncharacterized protein